LWPSVSERRRPRMRPSTSVPPPGANGTTMVTGRAGQLWAAARLAAEQLMSKAVTTIAIVLVARIRCPLSACRRLSPYSTRRRARKGNAHDMALWRWRRWCVQGAPAPLSFAGKNGSEPMKFGVFDHLDDAGVPLGQLY